MMEKNFSSTILKVDGVKFQNVSWIFFYLQEVCKRGVTKLTVNTLLVKSDHMERNSLQKKPSISFSHLF